VTSKEDAVRAWKALFGRYQEASPIRFALTGDGTGAATSDVDGRVGWAWCRYDEEQSKVSQVFNPRFPGIPGEMPVVIGRLYPTDKYVQILGINEALYREHYTDGTIEGYLVPAHGQSHNSQASDPAPIDTGNIVPGMVHQTDPDSMEVIVESFRYINGLVVETHDTIAVDLSGVTPSVGYHQYVLIALTPSTGVIRTTAGSEVPTPAIPDVPDASPGDIPLAAVDVRQGENITNTLIFDYRAPWNDAGSGVLESLQQLAYVESELDYALSRHVVGG